MWHVLNIHHRPGRDPYVCVHADSVLCVGQMKDSPGAIERWKSQMEGLKLHSSCWWWHPVSPTAAPLPSAVPFFFFLQKLLNLRSHSAKSNSRECDGKCKHHTYLCAQKHIFLVRTSQNTIHTLIRTVPMCTHRIGSSQKNLCRAFLCNHFTSLSCPCWMSLSSASLLSLHRLPVNLARAPGWTSSGDEMNSVAGDAREEICSV